MTKTNKKNLSVEEIMYKIKQEVTKRKQKNSVATKHKVASECDVQFNALNVVSDIVEPFVAKKVFEYGDFSKYHDTEFIRNCYRGLLKREPDSVGFNHYLQLLRSGEKSKSEIISILHYSKEGRTKNVKLSGSRKRYILW